MRHGCVAGLGGVHRGMLRLEGEMCAAWPWTYQGHAICRVMLCWVVRYGLF